MYKASNHMQVSNEMCAPNNLLAMIALYGYHTVKLISLYYRSRFFEYNFLPQRNEL